jgi:hypothetical protein
MTIRTVGSALIKLLGLYFGASAVLGICTSLGYLLIPGPQGVLQPVQFALGASIGGWAGGLFVASLFVLRGDDIGRVVFPDVPVSSPHLTARRLLAVGVSLLGVSVAASGVAHLARAAATALWYAGGGRQDHFADAMRRLYPSPVDAGLSVVVGGLLAWQAAGLSEWLNRRTSHASES